MAQATRLTWLLFTLGAVLAAPTRAQSSADSTAIRATALDYIEGWYDGDVVRTEQALHPHLAKRFLERLPDGSIRLTDTSALELVQQVQSGGGSTVPASSRRTDVRLLDVFQDVASVLVDAHALIDYMHMVKSNGDLRIINVLWEIRSDSR